MANPYVIVFLLVGAIGLFGSGVRIGIKWERNDALAAVAVAQDTAIKAANAATDAEIKRALAAAKAEADARLANRTARMKGEADAIKKSRAHCARDDESMGLLMDAVKTSNGEAAAAAIVPPVVRVPSATPEWVGTIAQKLGVSSGGSVRPVPATTR